MPITPLPTPPSRQDAEATFVSRANAFLGALPQFATEANAQAVDVDTAREIAVAAANYRGDYVAGTTYQVGQSVTYLGDFFLAKTVNTGVTPVQGTNWQRFTPIASFYQEFTASGTWTRPANVTWVYVEAIGGGGGGGRGTSYGGGGGGGAFNARLFQSSDTGATVTVTVGAGGAGIPSGGGTASSNDGGNSSFGTLVVGPGGKGGAGVSSGTNRSEGGGGEFLSGGYAAGAGGMAIGVTGISLRGYNSVKGGAGGGAGADTGGAGGTSTEAGNGGIGAVSGASNAGNGTAPGGGGGGKDIVTDTDGASGNGAAGRVRVWAW